MEILLVVGIIAILAGIVIVAINPARQIGAARDSERKQMVDTINKAVSLFYIDKGYYPASTTDNSTALSGTSLEICDTGVNTFPASGVTCTSLLNLSELVPAYISAIPKDPSGGVGDTTYGTGYYMAKNTGNNMFIEARQSQLSDITIGSTDGVTRNYTFSGSL